MPITVIATVTTPATSRDLTTLQTVKDTWAITGTADDSFLSRAISQCSAAIERYCNRVFIKETVSEDIFLERDSHAYMFPVGVAPLQLSRWPVASVSSVTEDGAALTVNTDYKIAADRGQLIRLDSDGNPTRWIAQKVVVEYSAGYVLASDATRTLPYDIEDACGRLVWGRYAERRRDPFVKEEVVEGVGRTVYWIPGSDTGNFPPDIADILDNYRVPVVG